MFNDMLFLKIALLSFVIYSIYISIKYRKIFDYNHKIIQELNKKEKYIEKLENIIRRKI